MRKWPPNSAASAAVTHRRFGKAANGTSTQEVICMTNKWRAKINWKGIYILQEALQEGKRLFLENPGKEALKKEELQAPQMRVHVLTTQSTHNHVLLL